jgi:GNAT superfamily N-acetyltransferase
MVKTRTASLADYDDWLMLAKEVEPLFGPMVDDASFRDGLKSAMLEQNAFCVSGAAGDGGEIFLGGVVISREANEILWLAVCRENRRQGTGKALLAEAIAGMDRDRPVTVTTFDRTVEAGLPARKLYLSFGFHDDAPAGLNPAGIPTVSMVLAASS